MTRKTALLAVCLALTARRALAGVNRWTSTGPAGGRITQLVVDPTNPATLYAGTFGGGVFRSDDAGSTWRPTGSGLGIVQGLAISQSSPSVLYAAEDHFVYKTTDGGGHWSFAGAFDSGMVTYYLTGIAVDAGNPNIVFVAATDQHMFGLGVVFRSLDGGAHWSQVLGGVVATSGLVATDPRSPSTAYAELGGLSRTTDSGATWTPVGTGLHFRSLAFPFGTSVIFGGTSDSGVLVSLDRGDHWQPASGGLSGDALEILGLAAVPRRAASLYAATQAGLYRTDDSGISWHLVSAGARYLLRAVSETTLYAADVQGVVRSLDGGATWAAANRGLVATSVRSMTSAGPTVLASSDFDVYRSADGGDTWSLAFTTSAPGVVYLVAADPSASLYVGLCEAMPLLSRSVDLGQTWLPFDEGLSGDCVTAFGAQASPGGYLFAGMFQHLFRRGPADGAWHEIGALTARSFFSDPARPNVVWAGTDQGLFRSDDSGATWSATGFAKVVSSIVSDPTNPDTLYLATYYCCDQAVYKSIDGGTAWTPSGDGLPNLPVRALAIDPLFPDTLYATTEFGIYRSVNGSLGWSAFSNGLRFEDLVYSPPTSLVFEPSRRRLLVGTFAAGVGSWDLTQDRRLSAAASLHGAAGTFFHSDVAVLNTSRDHVATIQPVYDCFLPPCGTETGSFTLAPRQAATFVDVVGGLFAAPQTGGAVELRTGDPVVVTSRLYTPTTPAPTVGMFVPGLDPAAASPTQIVLLLSHSADPGAGSRTNIGVWNPNDEELDATFSFFHPDGTELGQLVRHLAALGALQINDADIFEALGVTGDVESFYAVIEGDGVAPIQAYAAVIDNLSQDPFFVVGQPGARQPRGDFAPVNRVVVPAVASIHGHAGTFFHSDLAIWNPSVFPTDVTIRYRCFSAACSSASQTLTLQPGEMRVEADVVAGLLAAPETGGALELEGNRPLVAASRLYTPSHPAPTVGMFVPGLGPADATPAALLTSLSRSADLSKGFRTNVGVFNASDEAHEVTITLFDVDGHSLGSISQTVEARAATQINDVFRAAGILGDVQNAYASVRAPAGSALYAYAAVIDNQSQDPIFVTGRNDPNPPPVP